MVQISPAIGEPNTFIFGFGKLSQDDHPSCLPPTKPWQLKYSFGDPHHENEEAYDVAAYGRCAKKQHVFLSVPSESRGCRVSSG